MTVTSVDDWERLPEIAFPTIETEAQKGSVYTVHKVGFLLVSSTDSKRFDTSAVVKTAGKYAFPTAIVEFDQEKTFCRLPLQLSNWALDTVALAHQKLVSLPMEVEVGILRGRHYVEIL